MGIAALPRALPKVPHKIRRSRSYTHFVIKTEVKKVSEQGHAHLTRISSQIRIREFLLVAIDHQF